MSIDKIEQLLYNYRKLVSVNSVRARKLIMRFDYQNNFYLLQCIAQTYLDESRFEDGSNRTRRQINVRKWKMAERYIIRAFNINDDHAECLYTMGEVRKLGNQNRIAIYCFERIIKLGVNLIAKQEYSRGKDFAMELVNDARFELYRLYFYENPKLSQKYLNLYQREVEKGVGTIFKPFSKFKM